MQISAMQSTHGSLAITALHALQAPGLRAPLLGTHRCAMRSAAAAPRRGCTALHRRPARCSLICVASMYVPVEREVCHAFGCLSIVLSPSATATCCLYLPPQDIHTTTRTLIAEHRSVSSAAAELCSRSFCAAGCGARRCYHHRAVTVPSQPRAGISSMDLSAANDAAAAANCGGTPESEAAAAAAAATTASCGAAGHAAAAQSAA